MRHIWLIALLVFSLAACSTTTSELKNSENKMQWRVDAPVETVFKAYKGFAEDSYEKAGIMDRQAVRGHFYGDNAALSIRYEGNPLGEMTQLHMEMVQDGDGTLVNGWHRRGAWGEVADQFRSLPLP